MANTTAQEQATQAVQEKQNGKIVILGAGNATGTTVLSQGVVVDSLPFATKGMNTMGVHGVNGKGEEGKENPFLQNEDTVKAPVSLQAIKIARELREAEHFDMPSPTEKNVTYRVVFDVNRSKTKPLALFKIAQTTNKDGKLETEVSQMPTNDGVKLVEPQELDKNVLAKMVQTISLNFNKLESKPAISKVLKEQGLTAPSTESQYYQLLQTVTDNITQTDEKTLRMAFLEQDLKYPDNGLGVYSFIASKGGLYFGKDYESTVALVNAFNHRNVEDSRDGVLHKEVKKWAKKTYDDGVAIDRKVEAEMLFGVDANGNVVVVEDSNIPYKSGGTIYKEYGLEGKMAEVDNIKKQISSTIWAKLAEANPQKYTKDENSFALDTATVVKLEKTLEQKAQKIMEELGKGKEYKDWVAGNTPISSVVESNKEELLLQASNTLNSLVSVIREGFVQEMIKKDPTILVKDGMFKDGRQMGVANSSPKKPMSVDFKNQESVIAIMQTLPKITKYGESNAILNIKNVQIPVMKIKVDKDGKAIDLQVQNTLGKWEKQQKLIRVLHSILKIDVKGQNAGQILSSLINKGSELESGKRKGELSGYGLGALKEDVDSSVIATLPEVAEVIKKIQDVVYAKDEPSYGAEEIEAIKKIINGLKDSDNHNLRAIGLGVEVMKAKEEVEDKYLNNSAIKTLRAYPSRDDKKKAEALIAKQKEIKELMLRAINTDTTADEELKIEKGYQLSALIAGEYIKPRVQSVLNADKDALEVAKKIGFKAKEVKEGKLFTKFEQSIYFVNNFYDDRIKTLETETVLVGTKNKAFLTPKQAQEIAEVYKPNAELKERFETVREALRANYAENKVEMVRKDALYQEDTAIDVDISFDFGEFQDEEINKAVEDIKEKQQDAKDDVDAEMERAIEEQAQKEFEAENAGIDAGLEAEITPANVFNEEDPSITIIDEDVEEVARKREQQMTQEVATAKITFNV